MKQMFSMENFKLHMLVIFTFLASTAMAQNVTVRGHVTDAKGESILGVSVIEQGTAHGITTDLNGNFQIKVEDAKTAVLEFSFLGYADKAVSVNGATALDVVLAEDNQKIDEVVVTALGIKRSKKSLGYATQEVNSEAVATGNDANVMNKLMGKMAGVQITAGNSGAGSSSRVVIRGESSFSNDNQPLYIVDGVPITNYVHAVKAGTAQEIDYGNGAGELNSYDIESMTVLKGANAAALYGSRAANGVILITTKRGGKGGNRVKVDVNSTTTFETVARLPEYQNSYSQGNLGQFEYWDGNNGHGGQDQQDMSWGRPINGDLVAQVTSPSVGADGVTYRGGDVIARNGAEITPTPLVAYPNNVKDFFETGVTTNNNISLSGSNDVSTYRLSYTNFLSTGVLPNVDLERNTFSLNTTYKFSDKFNVASSVSYIHSVSSNRPSMGYGAENVMYQFAWFARQIDINALKDYWQAGQEGVKQFHTNSGWNDNPYFTMYENTNGYDKNRMFGNISLNYDILDNLKLSVRTGIDYSYDTRESKRAYSSRFYANGAYKREHVFFSEWNTDALLQWNKKLNDIWSTNLAVGGNSMMQKSTYDYNFANGLSVPGVYNLGNAASTINVSQVASNKRIDSAFFTGELAYKDMIFLNVTARNDWSSSLTRADGTGNNSYFYPSVSLSAVMSDIFTLPRNITYWSVRGGYAEVGSDTEPYRLEGYYDYTSPYGSTPGVSMTTSLANYDLKPERMNSFEIGTDFRMFDNRVGIDLTYYNTLNKNQIIEIPISATSGYQTRFINAGKIRNYGIEASLSLVPVRTKDFEWRSNFNFTTNDSRVEEISDEYEQYTYAWTAVYADANARVFAIAKEGEEMGNLYGTGLKRTDDGTIIVDETGLPIMDNEIVKLGNYNADFTLGFQNSFKYKGFNFDCLVDWHQGGVFVSRSYGMGIESGVLKETEHRESSMVIDAVVWDEAKGDYVQNTKGVSAIDYYRGLYRRYNETELTFDASFVKLREVKLGYTLPSSLFKNTGIDGINVSVVGRNLFMWTADQNYYDPESISQEGSTLTPGVEEMAYPSTKSIGFSVNLSF